LFSNRAVDVIQQHEEHATVPLFLYVALHNTHAPIEAPADFVAMYNFSLERQNNFDAQVSFVDHSVRNITDALKAKNMWDRCACEQASRICA
jgi:hypothetical protein